MQADCADRGERSGCTRGRSEPGDPDCRPSSWGHPVPADWPERPWTHHAVLWRWPKGDFLGLRTSPAEKASAFHHLREDLFGRSGSLGKKQNQRDKLPGHMRVRSQPLWAGPGRPPPPQAPGSTQTSRTVSLWSPGPGLPEPDPRSTDDGRGECLDSRPRLEKTQLETGLLDSRGGWSGLGKPRQQGLGEGEEP